MSVWTCIGVTLCGDCMMYIHHTPYLLCLLLLFWAIAFIYFTAQSRNVNLLLPLLRKMFEDKWDFWGTWCVSFGCINFSFINQRYISIPATFHKSSHHNWYTNSFRTCMHIRCIIMQQETNKFLIILLCDSQGLQSRIYFAVTMPRNKSLPANDTMSKVARPSRPLKLTNKKIFNFHNKNIIKETVDQG